MPLPAPRDKEAEGDFISRAIREIHKLHPEWEDKQVIAVAYTQWRESKHKVENMKPIEFNFGSDIVCSEIGKQPLRFRGVALNAGLIQAKNLIVPRGELQGLADSLKQGIDGKGAYILQDHKKETEKLLGRVTNAWVSQDGNKVEFEGYCADEVMAKKIQDGLVTYLSSGLLIDREECSICGADYLSEGCNHRLGRVYDGKIANIIGRGVKGREVSTVLYPADVNAKINIVLSAAISDIEQRKEKMFNKGELYRDTNKTNRGEKKVSVIELTEEQLANHPFVADLMDKISKFTETELVYKKEISDFKDKVKVLEDAEKTRVEAQRIELVNTLVSKRKTVGLPDKKPEDYKDVGEKSLKEMIEMVDGVSQRSKGIVEFSDNVGNRDAAKKAMKLKIGW